MDMKSAQAQLSQALEQLESTVVVLLSRLAQLEAQAVTPTQQEEPVENAELIQQLEAARSREAAFGQLADETMTELDRVIIQVKSVLEKDMD